MKSDLLTTVADFHRQLYEKFVSGEDFESGKTWLLASPQGYQLGSTDDEWDNGTKVFRARVPGFLHPASLLLSIELEGRNDLVKAMRILRKPRLKESDGFKAAELIGKFIGWAAHYQANPHLIPKPSLMH
jgi:hypothetical protein